MLALAAGGADGVESTWQVCNTKGTAQWPVFDPKGLAITRTISAAFPKLVARISQF
jgi:hypothetical protein